MSVVRTEKFGGKFWASFTIL